MPASSTLEEISAARRLFESLVDHIHVHVDLSFSEKSCVVTMVRSVRETNRWWSCEGAHDAGAHNAMLPPSVASTNQSSILQSACRTLSVVGRLEAAFPDSYPSEVCAWKVLPVTSSTAASSSSRVVTFRSCALDDMVHHMSQHSSMPSAANLSCRRTMRSSTIKLSRQQPQHFLDAAVMYVQWWASLVVDSDNVTQVSQTTSGSGALQHVFDAHTLGDNINKVGGSDDYGQRKRGGVFSSVFLPTGQVVSWGARSARVHEVVVWGESPRLEYARCSRPTLQRCGSDATDDCNGNTGSSASLSHGSRLGSHIGNAVAPLAVLRDVLLFDCQSPSPVAALHRVADSLSDSSDAQKSYALPCVAQLFHSLSALSACYDASPWAADDVQACRLASYTSGVVAPALHRVMRHMAVVERRPFWSGVALCALFLSLWARDASQEGIRAVLLDSLLQLGREPYSHVALVCRVFDILGDITRSHEARMVLDALESADVKRSSRHDSPSSLGQSPLTSYTVHSGALQSCAVCMQPVSTAHRSPGLLSAGTTGSIAADRRSNNTAGTATWSAVSLPPHAAEGHRDTQSDAIHGTAFPSTPNCLPMRTPFSLDSDLRRGVLRSMSSNSVECCSPHSGVVVQCSHCGHGGHYQHMVDWWSSPEATSCPAGCECICSY